MAYDWESTSFYHCYLMKIQSPDKEGDDNADCDFNATNIPLLVMFIIVTISGLVNNSMSLFVFFNVKYNTGLLPVFIRTFHIVHATLIVTMPLSLAARTWPASSADVAKVVVIGNSAAIHMVYSLGVAISVARCLYLACPLRLPKKQTARNVALVGILAYLIFSVALHFKYWWIVEPEEFFNYQRNIRLHMLAMVVLVIMFNTLATVMAHYYRKIGMESPLNRRMANLINTYVFFVTVLGLVTSGPVILNMFLPRPKDPPLSCGYCLNFMNRDDGCVCLAYAYIIVDNVLFCLLSEKYRDELKKVYFRFCSPVTSYITTKATEMGPLMIFFPSPE